MFGARSKCPYLEGIDLHIRFHVLEDVLEHLEREDLFALHDVCRSQSGSCCCCCLRNTHFSKEFCGGSYSQPYSRSFARTQYLLLYCRKRTALFSFRFPLYSLFIDFAQTCVSFRTDTCLCFFFSRRILSPSCFSSPSCIACLKALPIRNLNCPYPARTCRRNILYHS